MATIPWQLTLRQELKNLLEAYHEPRVAILGVGNELHGDDAAGIVFARVLLKSHIEDPQLMVVSTGTAPENFTGLLRLFAPDLVFLVDAARMDKAPGVACLLDFQSIEGCSGSTHTLPLHIFANYLSVELGCKPVLIGIQPDDVSMDTSLSPTVRVTITTLVHEFIERFGLQHIPSLDIHQINANERALENLALERR